MKNSQSKHLPRTNMGLLDIPNELLLAIGEFLSIKDLASLRKTCHHHSSLYAKCHYRLGLQRDYGYYTALQWAARRGHASLVEQALLSGARIEEKGAGWFDIGPLHLAAKRNHHEVMRILLKHNAPIEALGAGERTPLHYAAECKSSEGAKLLLEHGADVMSLNMRGYPPAFGAAQKGNVGCVEAFIAAGFDLNFKEATGRTLLHIGASSSVEMLRYLLQYKELKLAVNVRDCEGVTPLHNARIAENIPLLLDNGADMESKDNKGNTLAHYAASAGRLSSMALLIDVGFDIKTRGEHGYTVLHTAIDYQRRAMVKYLLDEGGGAALINFKDSNGFTPLALATRPGRESSIKLLIECGADLEAKDEFGVRLADSLVVRCWRREPVLLH